MTTGQAVFLAISLAGCLAALAALIVTSRSRSAGPPAANPGDREQVLQMLRGVKDQFALSVYQRVYRIGDHELRAGAGRALEAP